MTPRRRISPRARRRYRAVKDFFKRAIGGSSQTDMEINSSTAVNVTDLKHKIVGLEEQLSAVSRTCREFMYLEGSRRETQSLIPSELKEHIRRDNSTRRQSHAEGIDTPYETSERSYKKSEGSDYTTPKHSKENVHNFDPNTTKIKKKRSEIDNRAKHFDINPNSRKHKSQTAFETVESAWSTSSFHSLSEFKDVPHSNPGYSGNQTDRRAHKADKKSHRQRREEVNNEQSKRVEPKNYENHREAVKHSKNRKSKREINELDQDFIADIIKRQYKPVQMFGRKSSSISQFSEPMCRDREYTAINEKIPEETELCSCCYGGHHSPKHHRRSYERDAKSVCERNTRFKYHRVYTDAYNDSEFYDLIPVKEKSSPKTRRKFAQDNFDNYHDYREVPPSPRTHRPRLNLKAQYYTGSENDIDFVRHHNTRVSPKRHNIYHEPIEAFQSDYSSQILIPKKSKQRQKLHSKPKQVHEIGTVSSLQCPHQFDIEQNNTTVDTALNNTQESVTSTDKTDRTLFEIKDILQSFLQEIKKESSSSGKSDVSSKITENCVSNTIPPASVNPNSGHSFNNYSAPQCSAAPTPYIMPPYPNPCCYPVLPMYSMNCMQNGYVMPSQSFTCCCAAKAEDTTDKNKGNNTTASNETFANDTDELIKEIYKFVAQSPTFSRKQDDGRNTENETKKCFESIVYTSRSAGDSTRISKHDAKVGTPVLRCVSKSCEALGSRMAASDAYYSETNRATTYSDSVATASFVSELSNELVEKNQMSQPNTKIGKMLRSFGIFKKKKTEAIDEVSESESTIDVEILKKAPFRQDYASYHMTNQVYDRPPPIPYEYRHPQYPHDYRPPYDPAMQNYPPPPPPPNDPYYDPRVHQPEPPRVGGPHYYPGHPSAPPYMNPYENFNQMQPQVPVCLKEIEVKSMATQSEQKISFFRKLKKKMQPPVEQTKSHEADHHVPQTAQNKPGLWKSLQARAESKNERLTYSLQDRQGFDAGTKLRNAMIKKMFYKRNPFSPKNLIMKTLLGKDKANYEPPKTRHAPFFIMS